LKILVPFIRTFFKRNNEIIVLEKGGGEHSGNSPVIDSLSCFLCRFILGAEGEQRF
jgi:hypothetical protein